MNIVSKYKNVLYFILIAVFIFVIIGFVFEKDNSQQALLSDGSGEQVASIAERELLSILLDLRRIELREEIFSDSVFISLKDFSQDLVPEPVGRNNPFAPVFGRQ